MSIKIIVLFIVLSMVLGCTKVKYQPGRDTHEFFGDGTFQILSSSRRMVLVNNDKLQNVETNVYKYRDINPFVYVIGEKGFTLIDYKNKTVKQNSQIEYFSTEEKEIFNEIEKE